MLRDSTMVSAYSVLLFGGRIRVHPEKGTITVGRAEWVSFKAEARIGALIKALREAMSALLAAKIERPREDIASSPVVEAILRLVANG